MTDSKNIAVTYDNQLVVECASSVSGTSGNAVARYNSQVVQPEWSLVSGEGVVSLSSDGSF